MTNYVKSTNFASKDSLATGNPLKIVKGTEIDTEFNNISTAVATKADLSSPSLIGVPTTPTASYGTNNTQVASTAFVQAALQAVYPVGSVYINAGSTTNPASLLGFGTWVEFGAGRVLVGQNTSDALFDTLEETGGSKDAIVVSHSHSVSDTGHYHTTSVPQNYGGGGNPSDFSQWGLDANPTNYGVRYLNSDTKSTGISIVTAGSSGTNANVQPYIVVKMWKRTA